MYSTFATRIIINLETSNEAGLCIASEGRNEASALVTKAFDDGRVIWSSGEGGDQGRGDLVVRRRWRSRKGRLNVYDRK